VNGKPDTDAGHLLARGMGGAREEINLVQMVRDLNRGWGGRSLADANSVRHVEIEIERALKSGNGPVAFDLTVDYTAKGAQNFNFAPTWASSGKPIASATTSIGNE
jgi:hypothetical protein